MDSGSLSEIPRYLVLILLFLAGGAYFAAAETAFASVSEIRMISGADDGDPRARKVLYVLDRFDKALTTILVGNNIMHIACSSVATLLASRLWGNAAVTLTTFVTAFVVFILAEMIPKAYAKACNETLAPKLAGSLIVLMKLLTPVTILFSGISALASRIAGRAAEEDVTVTEEELFDIIENIDGEDEIGEEEAALVQSALQLTVKPAREILIPWQDVETIPFSISNEALLSQIEQGHYSRYPALDEQGNILGVLQVRKVLKAYLRGRKVIKSRAGLDAPYYVSADAPIDELLQELSQHRTHMAFVKDADGSLLGIITVEDILEELVGEIYDEEEQEAADA